MHARTLGRVIIFGCTSELLEEVKRVNASRQDLDVQLFEYRSQLEQVTHDYKEHTFCAVKLHKVEKWM